MRGKYEEEPFKNCSPPQTAMSRRPKRSVIVIKEDEVQPLDMAQICKLIAYGKLSKRRKMIVGVFFAFLIVHMMGCTDFLFEIPFESFNWPRNTRTEEMTGRSAIVTYPTTCPKQEDKILFIFIKSFVENILNRDALRGTWAQKKTVLDYEIIPIFVVGSFHEDMHDAMKHAVEREAMEYNDMMVLSTVDSYRNNTYKFIQSIWYANDKHYGCSKPDFALLIDDDYFLNVPALIKHLTQLDPDDNRYEGFVFNTTPFRFRFHKHHVELRTYPFNRYPPYVTAGAMLLSKTTLEEFEPLARKLAYFPFDDIYAGILAKLTGVNATHNEKFTYWSKKVSLEAWERGEFIAVHGYSIPMIYETFDLLSKRNYYNQKAHV